MKTIRCRPLVLALAVALVLPAPAAWAQAGLPALGESASGDFSVTDERRIGEQIMRSIRRDPAYLDDPVLLEYVRSLWEPLVSAARRQGHVGLDTGPAFAWEAFLVRDRSVNAFALPGGHVGVHLGLISMTEYPDELASVLAHELSHVTQRHIARRIGASSRNSMVGLAAMIVGVLAASRAGNADAAQAAIVGSQAALLQGELNFSRDMEREADRIGYGVLEGAGFTAGGMSSMFEKLAYANRLTDNGAYPYLRSHPLSTDRISEARDRVPAGAGQLSASPLHGLMRARARVLMDTSAAALARAQAPAGDAGDGEDRLGRAYQAALASALLKDAAAAKRALETAQQLVATPAFDTASRRAVQRLAAETMLALGEPGPAQAALAEDGAGEGRPGLLLRAQATLAAAEPDALRRSAEALQVWTADHPDDGAAWSLLGQTAGAAGQRLRSQRAHAEAALAVGDLTGAVDRLRAAQRGAGRAGAGDAIELQIIDARLRALERQLREERERARAER